MKVSGILQNFAETTSAHGIPHIGSAKKIFCKLFWTIVVIASGTILALNILALVENYFSYPVTVNTELHFKPLKFPAVTLCNINPYKLSEAGAVFPDFTFPAIPDLTPNLFGVPDPEVNIEPMLFEDASVMEERLAYKLAPKDSSVKLQLGHSINELILKCTINGASCSIENDFKYWFNPRYGNCFSFNYEGKYVTTKPGPANGLMLLLNVSKSEYMPTTKLSGARFVIHDQNDEPFPGAFGLYAPTGFATAFSLRYVERSKLSEPYGECITNSSEVSPYYYKHDYSVEACYRSCFQKQIIDKCGCAAPWYEIPGGASYCPYSKKDCVDMWSQDNLHICHCPPKCMVKNFETSVSAANWPAPLYQPADCVKKADEIGSSVMGELQSASKEHTEKLLSTLSGLQPARKKRQLGSLGVEDSNTAANLENLTPTVEENTVDVLSDNINVPDANDVDSVGNVLEETVNAGLNAASSPIMDFSPMKSIVTGLAYSECLNKYRDNTAAVEVFYGQLNYEYFFEEPAYGIVNLISDFGGQLGLWLGFSAITSVEIVVLIATLLGSCFFRSQPDKNSKLSPTV